MNFKNKNGDSKLAKKSLSVVAASLALLSNTTADANNTLSHEQSSDNTNVSKTYKKKLKSRLVLKLNINEPDKSIVAMHGSHSSHASHASHASHSSSSVSYPDPVYTPPSTYTPPRPTPAPRPTYVPISPSPSTTSEPINTKSSSSNSYYEYPTTQRILYKGLEGDDVKDLQLLLKKKGYSVPTSGYFGEQTEVAVKKFQKVNDLPEDGKVGALTLSLLNK